MRRAIAAFARNGVFANILLIAIIFAGVVSSMLMVREMFPEFALEIVTVQVPYPGADPEEVEEGICRKIEEAIDGIEGIKEYTTTSSEGMGSASIEIIEGYDVAKAKDEIKNRVDSISTFPVDAERPIVSQVTIKREVIVIALSGPLTERGLKEWAERVKDELRALDGVSQVTVAGARDYEIAIELSEDKLRQYGLTFDEVAGIVRANSLNMPGGTMRTEGEEIRLRTIGRNYWGDQFRDIVLLSGQDGQLVTLDRVATITDGFVPDQIISRFNGEAALMVTVSKTSEEDAIDISNKVTAWVEDQHKRLPPGLKMTIWSDSSELIEARINLLVRNGAIGLIIVFVLLWIFLDLRLSFWGAMGIPISLAGALALMYSIGATLNMISLFGLIMVIGIVVDDAIVVGEAIYYHRKNGAPPLRAAVDGVVEVGIPVIAAVTTTIIAFIPLMLVSGIMGKFIRIMPVAVIATLAISLIECLILLPAHLSHLPDPNDPTLRASQRRNPLRRLRRGVSDGLEWFVHHAYMPFLGEALRWRYVAVAVAIAVLSVTGGLRAGGFLKFVMFPPIDGDSLTATVEFPNGTPGEVTQDAVKRIEQAFHDVAANAETRSGDPLVENMFSMVGGSMDGRGQGDSGPHTGSVRVEMLGSQHRGIYSREIIDRWEKAIGGIPGSIALTISGREGGPPGKPIEVWILGQNMDDTLAAADELVEWLNQEPGLSQEQSDFRPGKNEIRFELRPEARTQGITVRDLARQVYAGFYGEEALRIQRGRDDIRVRVRYPAEERNRLSTLADVRVRTPQGQEVPLLSVADISFTPGYSTITRTNGERRVMVSADVDNTKANAQEVFAKLENDFFPDLRTRYPALHFSLQGEKKDSAESLGSLMVGFPLALLGIFVIIATIFRSYAQPMIIMVTVPFGIIGAMWGHLIMGFPITMISMFGIVALSGVVVNDAIVLIECINSYVADGVPFFEALRRGGARRFRAIFLTTLSTVGGLTPMILEKDLQAQFLIPMAISIAYGVAFATLLTLFLIPCLLGILNDLRRVWFAARYQRWPGPDEVEPARTRNVDLLDVEEPGVGPDAEPEPAATN